MIAIPLTVKEHRVSSSPRGPTRVRAEDAAGNSVALVYFGGNSGWVKKLLPIGETKIVSGRLDLYGQDLQIVHPDLGDSTEGFREREAIYPLSEGITSRRLGALAVQAVERSPDLPEWIEPGLKAQRGWPDWSDGLARIHADPGGCEGAGAAGL